MRLAPLLVALLVALPARADILLSGYQHIGDDDTLPEHTPRDPVTRAQMQSFPSRFHLTQSTTITAVRFDDPVDLDGHIPRVYLDGTARAGTLGGNVYTLSSPVTLGPGVFTLAPDPGCLDAQGQPAACPGATENDISFSSLTLLSSAPTLSRALNRRRHLGDDNETVNDNYGGAYYPDVLDPPPADVRADIPFSIDSGRVLNTVELYRARGVNTTAAGNHAQVLVNGRFIGELTASGDPFRISTSVYLDAGPHTLSVVAGFLDPGNRDSFSWDDTLLLFSAPVAGTPGRFNLVDRDGDAVNGVIQTKVAGASFTFDIVALNLQRNAQLPDYSGTVAVSLLDASDDTAPLDVFGCRSSWTVVSALGTRDFAVSDGGRQRMTLSHNGLLRRARLMATDSARGVSGCSRDAFAVRPHRLQVLATHGGPAIPGDLALDNSGTDGSVLHWAGQPFSLRVRPLDATGSPILAGWSRTPAISAAVPIVGAALGTLSTDGWSGQSTTTGYRRSNTVRYSEAGAFVLRAEDPGYADVDAADGSTAAQREVEPATATVGRFTPNEFRLVSSTPPVFSPACGSFGHVGQPFGYQTAPEAVFEAVNASGGVTLNYAPPIFRMPGSVTNNVFSAVAAATGATVALDTSAVPSPSNAVEPLGGGRFRLRFDATARLRVPRTTPVAAFDLEIQLLTGDIQDLDAIALAPSPARVRFGTASAGNGIAFAGNGKQQRWSRLTLANGYGPETQPLDISAGTEYFTGGGWARNLADGCTTLAAPALSGGVSASTAVLSTTSPLVAGRGTIRLAAPQVAGRVDLSLPASAWLGTDANGDNIHAEPASSTATFGQFRQSEQRIYQRETFR